MRCKLTSVIRLLIGIILVILLSFSIAFAGQGPSEKEVNDTRDKANSITGTSTVLGILDSKDREDWYLVTGQIGPAARFTLEVPQKSCFKLSVFQGDKLIGSTSGKKQLSETITCNITGKVHIQILWSDGGGGYNLKIVKVQPTKPKPPGPKA